LQELGAPRVLTVPVGQGQDGDEIAAAGHLSQASEMEVSVLAYSGSRARV